MTIRTKINVSILWVVTLWNSLQKTSILNRLQGIIKYGGSAANEIKGQPRLYCQNRRAKWPSDLIITI